MKHASQREPFTFAQFKIGYIMKGKRYNSKKFILIFAALLSAFGPFMTDLYLPAFPELKEYFGTTASLVQLSLTFGMIGLAGGQLLIGPLSDKYGRRLPLILSLVVFVLSTVACLFCESIGLFILFRLFQGISAAGGVVIARSIVVDLYEGKEFRRFFSLLSGVQGLAPIAAPVIGGMLLEVTDWLGIYTVLLLIGIVILMMSMRFRESLLPERRAMGSIISTFSRFRPVLKNKRFICYVLVLSFAMGVMFAYISASPFIFQVHYGLSPMMYSYCFACNAFAIMIGNLVVARFPDARKALFIASLCLPVLGMIVAVGLIGNLSVLCVELGLFVLLFFVGMIFASSTALALDSERNNSGNASALLGFFQFLFAGLVAPLVGIGDVLHSTGSIILIGSLIVLALVYQLKVHDKTIVSSVTH